MPAAGGLRAREAPTGVSRRKKLSPAETAKDLANNKIRWPIRAGIRIPKGRRGDNDWPFLSGRHNCQPEAAMLHWDTGYLSCTLRPYPGPEQSHDLDDALAGPATGEARVRPSSPTQTRSIRYSMSRSRTGSLPNYQLHGSQSSFPKLANFWQS